MKKIVDISNKIKQKLAYVYTMLYFSGTKHEHTMKLAETKDTTVKFRVSTQRKRVLKRIAADRGMTLTAFVFSVLDKEIEKGNCKLVAA